MTVHRKKKEPDSDTEATTPESFDVKWGLGTKSFRYAILILVLSMHPVGRKVLSTFGFEFPDERKLTVATEKTETTSKEIQAIAKTVEDISKDVNAMKISNAILNTKVDGMDQKFQGFQIDFSKYKHLLPKDETTNENK